MADAPITNDVKGKVAVVIRGGASFTEKAQAVQAVGAIGMIVANSDDCLGRLVGKAPDVSIPYATIFEPLLAAHFVATLWLFLPRSLTNPLLPQALTASVRCSLLVALPYLQVRVHQII